MCGIAGIFRKDGSVDESSLKRMSDSISHRGPDDDGVYLNENRTMGLAHRRLSIIDLSSSGHQPMTDENQQVWIVFNGEIYNFQSLREDLIKSGYKFRSGSDTEVIVNAYLKWGHSCVEKLRGMFAFAIWDTRDESLFFARDRFGIKPFIYTESDGEFAFASELKAITSLHGAGLAVDNTAIFDFFTYGYIPTPKTIYANVKKLPPAHFGVIKDGNLRISEYWDIPFGDEINISAAEAAERTAELIHESMKLHLIADVPIGVLLSGGLDSSTLAALTAINADESPHTFTIGFDVAAHDERSLARLTADKYNTKHHEQEIDFATADGLRQRVMDIYDEPFADTSSVPTYIVSSLARKNVKVALSGDGGDELFAGYKHYFKWLRLSKLRSLPDWARAAVLGWPAKMLPDGAKGKWSLATAALPDVARYAAVQTSLSASDRRGIFSKEFLRDFDGYDPHWYFRKYWREDLDPITRMQYVDIKTALPDKMLTKVDRASMAVSLEARVPLLDHKLAEFVATLPGAIRNRNSGQKHMLREFARDYLSPELFEAKKRGFSAPMGTWLSDAEPPSIDNVDTGVFSGKAAENGLLESPKYYWRVQLVNSWLNDRQSNL